MINGRIIKRDLYLKCVDIKHSSNRGYFVFKDKTDDIYVYRGVKSTKLYNQLFKDNIYHLSFIVEQENYSSVLGMTVKFMSSAKIIEDLE